MTYNRIVLSSGHGKFVRGASGILDEVDEARKVVDALAIELKSRGVDAITFHDDVSKSQSENLNRIVNFHNSKTRDLDISCHFNAFEQTAAPRGTEVLYVTQMTLADKLSEAIASVGFIDRGPKKNTGLAFLNGTEMPAVLLEICFVDSEADANIYRANQDRIVQNMAFVLGGEGDLAEPPPMSEGFSAIGKVSHFGGPDDTGVAADEGLAFIYKKMDAPHLFLPDGAPGTQGKGLVRSLNPFVHYVACRWDYKVHPKPSLLKNVALVRALSTGIALEAFPSDWGPHQDTGRVAYISPGLMADLGITTDDEVEVIYPWIGN